MKQKVLKFIGSVIKSLLAFSFGKKAFQTLYSGLYHISLKGMNYDNVGGGEEWVLKEKVHRTAQEKPVIFDVGANIGSYSEMLLRLFGKNAEIYAFEPSKTTFRVLDEKLSGTGVKAFNIGLGDKKEEIKLFKDRDLSSIASVFQRKLDDQVFQDYEIIAIETLDLFCEEHKIGHIDFLKIDVEGNECNVLKGASKMLAEKRIQSIQFEFGGCNIDSKVFFRDIWELLHREYTISRILVNGLQPVTKYTERLEIFSYANYFAELKNKPHQA